VVADHQNSERQGGMSRSFPLSGMKEPVCPAVPPDLIIPCSSAPKLSNNIIQKGLVFARGWSRTVANSGAPIALRDPAPPAWWPRWGFGGAA
jgi:hypothetical protein